MCVYAKVTYLNIAKKEKIMEQNILAAVPGLIMAVLVVVYVVMVAVKKVKNKKTENENC